jgi:2,3-dihydroxybiphenyl 1,2-dioxygenase
MQLGFLEFECRDLSAWHDFLTQILGLVDVGAGRYRMDGHAWRIQLVDGPSNDLSAVGWEFTDEELDAALVRLTTQGVKTDEGDLAVRGCARRYLCTDPGGVPVELVAGLPRNPEPFASPVVRSGFVADEQGLGHLVVTAPDPRATRVFYEAALGFRYSDRIRTEVYGHPVDLTFWHANERHHSLAFGGQQRKRLHHFMVEARSMDEVGLAYDRALESGVRIMQTLGRHPNDRMFSFYALTPSKFQFEFGWGGREVDDATWEPAEYDHISEWGHHPPQIVFAQKPKG